MEFPLTTWETFRVIIAEEHTAFDGPLVKGIVTGKPGECAADLKHRARAQGMLGLFKNEHVTLEWIDR